MTPFESNDLAWQAFRYVAEEMSSAEVAEFELLLAESQAAQELARAVELTQGIAAAIPLEVAQPVSTGAGASWGQRLAWMLLGTAACLAAVASFKLWSQHADHQIAMAPGDLHTGQLAAAWAGHALAGAENSEETPSDSFVEPAAEAEADSDMSVPGWLLAAVEAQAKPADGADPTAQPSGTAQPNGTEN